MKSTGSTLSYLARALLAVLVICDSALAEPPASLSELTEAWDDWLVEQDQPMWGVLTEEWRDKTGGELKYPTWAKETSTRWIVESTSINLFRTVVRKDGVFDGEFARGSNADYVFHVSRSGKEQGYQLKSVAAAEGNEIGNLQQRIEGWSHPWQHRNLFVMHQCYLNDVVRRVPEAFELEINDGLSLGYAREKAPDNAPLGWLSEVKSASFQLPSTHPWIPFRHELEYDPTDERQEPGVIIRKFEDFQSIDQTLDPDGDPVVELTTSYEPRSHGDKDLLEQTRLAYYGLPEPAVTANASLMKLALFILLGASFVGIGVYLLRRGRAVKS